MGELLQGEHGKAVTLIFHNTNVQGWSSLSGTYVAPSEKNEILRDIIAIKIGFEKMLVKSIYAEHDSIHLDSRIIEMKV